MIPARAPVAFVNLAALSGRDADEVLDALTCPDSLAGRIGRAIILSRSTDSRVLPTGWHAVSGVSATQACQWAFDVAAEMDAPLLVVTGATTPTSEAVAALEEALAQDPLLGIAVPRIGLPGGRIAADDGWETLSSSLPRRVLGYQPEYRITTEAVERCLLIRRELAGNLCLSSAPWQTFDAALTDFSIRARRAGFRTVRCNRVVVAGGERDDQSPSVSADDVRALRAMYPELESMGASVGGRDAGRAERLLAAAFEAPDSLLLDARNLAALFNGTSAAILGLAQALYRARPEPSVTMWLHKDVAEWHGVPARFPRWSIHVVGTIPPAHAAAVRLSQPWHVTELETLQEVGAVNLFWMLDTIAWDIAYTAPDGLDRCWERMSQEADGLLFISDFSRQRFANRFGCAPGVESEVCRLSLAPSDYAMPVTGDARSEPYWLIVGNQYDHKHVAPTVDLLTRSFPEKRLVVFGDRDQVRTTRVTRFDSGPVDDDTVRACYARAEAVVFPSFYEGFGLPILQGLSYGRTIVTRESALVAELAARYRGPGRLLTYGTDRELVALLSGLERGQVPDGVPLGTAPDAGTWDWDAAAKSVLTMAGALVAASPSAQMLRRTGLSRGLARSLARR